MRTAAADGAMATIAPALPVIERATVAPGHDGAAELVVHLRFPNGAVDSVMLDADAAARLLARCGAESAEELAGADWTHLRHVLG